MKGNQEGFFERLAEVSEKGESVFALFDASNENANGVGLIAQCDDSQVQSLTGVPDSEDMENDGWSFVTLSYDLKNEIERLTSDNRDPIGFPMVTIWNPKIVTKWDNIPVSDMLTFSGDAGSYFKPSISKDEYLRNVELIQEHLQKGDVYEVNYCMGFEMRGVPIHPVSTFSVLQQRTRAPFSGFIKLGNRYLMCGSPERFLKRTGSRIYSQPIKGTIKRGENKGEDAALIRKLRNDPKERAENIMITDLVRNDLSKVAARGSVNVDELCEVHSFRTVHQMVSTISATIDDSVQFDDLIRATFPMGSMTGAPKIRAMELIEEIEDIKRGLYSGAIGYYTPSGDFDLNVVIRSIQYNAETHSTLVMVGGAITIKSDPVREYEECMLKADALLKSIVTR